MVAQGTCVFSKFTDPSQNTSFLLRWYICVLFVHFRALSDATGMDDCNKHVSMILLHFSFIFRTHQKISCTCVIHIAWVSASVSALNAECNSLSFEYNIEKKQEQQGQLADSDEMHGQTEILLLR